MIQKIWGGNPVKFLRKLEETDFFYPSQLKTTQTWRRLTLQRMQSH
ncbi:unnamed protein product [Brassica napus]|uniref:(rape) hypothetical protein n=1 Tax=Brassica napus TaxID=3708 RepID=A0A816SF94_BRANA|nr:unnamed protein product [Brassica napus]